MFDDRPRTLTRAVGETALAGVDALAKRFQGGSDLTTFFVMIPDGNGGWRVGSQIIQSHWLFGWRKQMVETVRKHQQAMRENGVTRFDIIETQDPRARSRCHSVWPPS